MTAPLQLDLDPSSYLASLGKADAATADFTSQVTAAALALGPMQRAINSVTPSRALLGGLGAAAAEAGKMQQQLATMAAQSTVTKSNMDKLSQSANQLARQLPAGNAGARQLYQQLSNLGVVSQGTEKNVANLATTFVKLSGATGEQAGGLAQGFIQLSRSMGTGFDAGRIAKIGDSLTTVAAKSGASATSILAFSKSIAPLSAASGIGVTKVLGISAAFSKLGDDGLGAATAFNKVLGDIKRSVDTGSPVLGTYAAIVGKTTAQFRDLAKNSPAEAVTQVTEALAKSKSLRPFDQLGLDGPRTQRYLQELSQSGGLRKSINDSTEGFGSGATNKAAQTAFGGLADASQRAASNAQQLAEALGVPLLKPLTAFTNLLGSAATPFRQAASSGIGQKAIEAGAGLLLLTKLLKPLAFALTVGGAATSGPVRSFFAGAANNRGAGPDSRLYRLGGGVSPLVAEGSPIGRGSMIPVNAFSARLGGLASQGLTAVNPGTGQSAFAQLRGAGVGLFGAYSRGTSELIRNARIPAEERTTRLTPRAGFLTGGREAGAVFDKANAAMVANEVAQRKGLITLGEQAKMNVRELGTIQGALSRMSPMQQAGMTGRALLAPAGQAIASTGVLAGRGLMGALGGLVGIGLLTGGAIGTAAFKGSQQQREYFKNVGNSANFLDDYRVAIGKATEATSTFAGQMKQSANDIVSGTKSLSQALSVDSRSQDLAQRLSKSKVTNFTGSNAEITAQLRPQILKGSDPQVVQRINSDLINSVGLDRAKQILAGFQNNQASLGDNFSADVGTQAQGIGKAKGAGGFRGFANIFGPAGFASETSGAEVSNLSKEQKASTTALVDSISERRNQRSAVSGGGVANKMALKEIDAATWGAFDSGNSQAAYRLENEVQKQFGFKNQRVGPMELFNDGGFSAYLAKNDSKNFAKAGFDDKSIAQATQTSSDYTKAALGTNQLADILSGRGKGAGAATAASLANPENTALQTTSLQAVIAEQGKSADGLSKLAASAYDATNKLDATGDAYQRAAAIFSAAMAQIQISSATRTTAGNSALQTKTALGIVQQGVPTTPGGKAIYDNARSTIQESFQQANAYAASRLTQQREFNVSLGRQSEDFGRQKLYSEIDFAKQEGRAAEDYAKGVFRTERSYLIGRRDSITDFHRQVMLSTRDFIKQQSREVQDGAKGLYDPYTRIAAKGVFDGQNLASNVNDQNSAIAKQIKDLGKVRKAGVSNTAIQLLGLNDPAQAQQLAEVLANITTDPKIATQINAAAKNRQSLGGALLGDPANLSFTRQKQDFATAMNDQNKTFAIGLERGRRNLHTTLADMNTDQATALSRATSDRNTAVARMNEQNRIMIARAGADLIRADTQIVGSLGQLTDALNKAAKGQFVDFKNISRNGLNDWLSLLKSFASGPLKDVVDGLSITLTATKTPQLSNEGIGLMNRFLGLSQEQAQTQLNGTGVNRHAVGAVFTRPTMFGNEQVGEAGPELALPLNGRGMTYLQDLMRRTAPAAETRMANAGSYSTVVTHNERITHDYSTHVDKVEVMANDAAAFADSMQARRQSNLTRPAQLR